VTIALAATLAISGCRGIVEPSPSRPARAEMASPSPSPSYLAPDDRWAPATHLEDGRRVMPVTFPDATTAELVYPPRLRLEELSVNPDTFVDPGPSECGSPVYASRYDPHEGWIRGEAPIAEHLGADGATVALWEGTPVNRPYDFLVYRFGSWTVLVPCRGPIGQDELAMWAKNLHGEESPDGLLVLKGTPPLVLHPWRDQHGPTLRMSDHDVVVDISPLSEQCDPASGWGGDTNPGDGVVQWCVQPEGTIYIYANGFTPEGKDLLQALVDDLEVREVQPGD
jgi:hypothetical protein